MTSNAPDRESREMAAKMIHAETLVIEEYLDAVDKLARYLASGTLPSASCVREVVENVRRFHFAHNPPNTGLACGFNSILDAIDGKTTE